MFSLVIRLRKGWTTKESSFDSLLDEESFTKASRPALGSIRRSAAWVLGLIWRGKAVHSWLLIITAKNEWTYASTASYAFTGTSSLYFPFHFCQEKGSHINCRVFLPMQYRHSVYTLRFLSWLKVFTFDTLRREVYMMLTAVRTYDLILRYAFAWNYWSGRYLSVR